MNFRPKLSLLRNEDVERIISSAYDLLATAGVKIKHEEGLQILSDHGASVDYASQIAIMPQNLIEKCLKTSSMALKCGKTGENFKFGVIKRKIMF